MGFRQNDKLVLSLHVWEYFKPWERKNKFWRKINEKDNFNFMVKNLVERITFNIVKSY